MQGPQATAASASRSRYEQLLEATARPDWDDEGGKAIPAAQWDTAWRFCEALKAEAPQVPDVFYSASGDGSIHLRWSTGTRSVDAELDSDQFSWSVRIDGRRSPQCVGRPADLIHAIRVTFD